MIPKFIKIHSKSIPNQPKGCPGALRKRAFMKRFGSFLDVTTIGASVQLDFSTFGTTWAILGAILVPSWAPRGSQNQVFWHKVAPKSQKMRPTMRHQKIYEMLTDIL